MQSSVTVGKMAGYEKVPIFILLSWCIVLATPASVSKRAVAEKRFSSDRIVSLDSRFCIKSQSQLYCDFKWTPGAVSLASNLASESSFKYIHIQKAHEFQLNYDDLRSDLSLAHITSVKVQGERCTSSIWKLSLRNTTLEVLTEPISSIYADESHVKNLTLNALSGPVTVIGSKVDTCRISEDTTETDLSLKIHSSTIKNFDKLNLTKYGKLLMQSSTIVNFSPESLVFDGSKNNLMSSVRFPVYSGDTPAHIILTNGADITLEDTSGAVKIASPPCPAVKASSSPDDGERVTTPRRENLPQDEEVYMHDRLIQNNSFLSIALTLSVFANLLLIISRVKTIAIISKIIKAILRFKSKKVNCVSEPLISAENTSMKMNNTMMFGKEENTEKLNDSSKSVTSEPLSKYGNNLLINKPSTRKRRVTFSGPYHSSSESISDN